MEHSIWFDRITNGASGLEASKKADLSTSTLNRQLSRGELSPETVIALSRAYGIHPAKGLASTGFFTNEEATGIDDQSSAELLSDRELIRELARRVNSDPTAWFGTFGELAGDESEGSEGDDAQMFEFPALDVDGLDYVADSSPDEPEEGDEGYHDGP